MRLSLFAPMRPLALAVSLAFAQATGAATITVTDGGDSATATTCTLRQAIVSANKNAHGTSTCLDGSGDDTIVFADSLIGSTITLAGSELAVTAPLTIIGSGQTLDANHLSRVMYVGNTTFSASALALINGATPGNSGAGMEVTGSTVYLDGVAISGNTGDNAAGVAAVNSTALTLHHSTVAGNAAQYKGGGLLIANNTTVTLLGSVVSGNSAARGGGAFTGLNGELQLQQSSISGNTVTSTATQSGGGVYGYRCTDVTITESTVSGNSANREGGGILAYNCPLLVVNSTVAYNMSTLSGGGGIYVENGTASIINSTISSNSAPNAGGMLLANATATLSNTIVSANSVDPAYLSSADIGAKTSKLNAQFCLLGAAMTGAINGSNVGNIFTDSPGLGALQDNGGPTLTMALLDGSAAIDSGSNALAWDDGHELIDDQRPGHPRVVGSAVDIGAFERQPDIVFASGFESLP